MILNELGIYHNVFRFSRATSLFRNLIVSPLHMKTWMGGNRLETAFSYKEKGGRHQRETGELLLELHGSLRKATG